MPFADRSPTAFVTAIEGWDRGHSSRDRTTAAGFGTGGEIEIAGLAPCKLSFAGTLRQAARRVQ